MTAAPTDTGGGTEANYTSYARLEVEAATGRTFTAATSASPSVIDNSADWSMPQSTGGSNTIAAAAIYDASSAGNLLAWGNLGASKAVESGDTPKFLSGALDISLD